MAGNTIIIATLIATCMCTAKFTAHKALLLCVFIHTCRLGISPYPVAVGSETQSNSRLNPDAVIRKYPKLLTLSNIGHLAVRFSCEAYFGKDILLRVTCPRSEQPLA